MTCPQESSKPETFSATHIYKLLEVVEKVRDYAEMSQKLESELRYKLDQLAENKDIEALAYVELIRRQESQEQVMR